MNQENEVLSSILGIFVNQPLTVLFILFIAILTLKTLSAWQKTVNKDKKIKTEMIDSLISNDSNNTMLASNDSNNTMLASISSVVLRDGTTLLRRLPKELEEQTLNKEWMPAFVTSIGVLGTFTGISIGLMDMGLVDLSKQGASSTLMDSITHLLDGMKTAFYTSVAGILAGLILSFIRHNAHLPKLKTNHSNAILALDNHNIRLFESADMLSANGSDDLVKAANAMADSARGFNADAIADKMTGALKPILEEVSTELKALREIKKENGEAVLEKMMTDLRSQVIEPIQERLENTASLVEQSTQSVADLATTITPLGEELSNTVDKLQLHQKESIDSIERVLTRFQEDVGEKLSQQLVSAGEVLNETLDKLNNDLGLHLQTLNSLAAQMPTLDAELVASIETVLNQVIGTSRELFKQLKDGADNQSIELKQLHTEVLNYHTASRQFLDEYVGTVNSTSSQVHSKLLDVARVLASASALSDSPSNSRNVINEPA